MSQSKAASADVSTDPPRVAGAPATVRRALVVGASTGMGAALVRQLVREGYAVGALARNGDALEELARECRELGATSGGRVVVRAHDVTDFEAVPALFEELVKDLGGLDLYVFSAGVMPSIEPREYSTSTDFHIVDVNLKGCIAWTNQVAQLFQTQRSGTIVGISSIAGDRGRKGNPVYCTSKAAMNTYLEALRNRLSEVGVHVCTIKPGYVATRMTEGMDGLFWVASPQKAAAQILAAARSRANTRYVLRRWWIVGTIIKSIPSFLFRHLNI